MFQVFDANVVIKELKVMGGGLAGRKSLGRLGVMSELEIRSLSVQRCDRATNCGDCVALQVRFLSNSRAIPEIYCYERVISLVLPRIVERSFKSHSSGTSYKSRNISKATVLVHPTVCSSKNILSRIVVREIIHKFSFGKYYRT